MLIKKQFIVVGINRVRDRVDNKKDYDVLSLNGEFFFGGITEGQFSCNVYVSPNTYSVGDVVDVIYHKGEYILID